MATAMSFEEVSSEESPSTVRHEGDLDIVTSEDVKRQLAGLVEEGSRTVALDLRGVGFVDSSGLGALVAVHHFAESRGAQFVVQGAPRHVLSLFSLTRLDNLLNVEPYGDGKDDKNEEKDASSPS
jgi:anti-sigma B factor antagonist